MSPILVKRILVLGFVSIWRHRLRSGLTILGIVFGVCSVIAMLAIGEGASYEAQEQIKKLGSQNIIINSVKPPEAETPGTEVSYISEYGLTYKDAARIRATIPTVEVIAPGRTIRADVSYGRKRADANAIGAVPWFPETANRKINKGRFFGDLEMRDHKNVCVVSDDLSRWLFTFQEPIGSVIRIRDDYYTVIGIIDNATVAPSNGDEGRSRYELYFPLTAARSRVGEVVRTQQTGSLSTERVELHKIIVKVDELEAVVSAAELIRGLLEGYHKQADFEIVVPLELLRQAEHTKRIFNIVLGSIAAISLLVGGIGIMNIMLASVTERTREIGIRRALGAKKRDILVQFLTETVLLSSCGGVIGLALGVAIPFFITYYAKMETIIRLWSLFGAFGISVCVGLIFGIYPAYRACVMNPITALRHE